jgi:hypothetical protein
MMAGMSNRIAALKDWLANEWRTFRLLDEARAFDSWLLVLAVVNWIVLSSFECRGIAPPFWYCYSAGWYRLINRILFAALCVRTRRTWFYAIAFLVSAQIVAGHLFYLFNPDEIALRFFVGSQSLWDFIKAVLGHELLQGLIAFLLAAYALRQIMRRLPRLRWFWLSVYALRAVLIFLFFGYLSNFISHAAAEKTVAKWIYQDSLKGSSFYGDVASEDIHELLRESAERFADIGAKVMKVQTGSFSQSKPSAKVGPSTFTGPFLIHVQYELQTSENSLDGNHLMFNFFGFVKIIEKDSNLDFKLLPYLWPY